MPKYKVCKVNDFGNYCAAKFEIEGHDIAVYCVDGTFYATADFCPHRGGSLGSGNLKGSIITCINHGWQFNIQTGACLNNPQGEVQTYPVTIDGGDVFVELE